MVSYEQLICWHKSLQKVDDSHECTTSVFVVSIWNCDVVVPCHVSFDDLKAHSHDFSVLFAVFPRITWLGELGGMVLTR